MTRPIDLSDFISIVLWSAYVKPSASGDKTVSAIIVAAVESGKTKLIEQFIDNNGIYFATNCTEYGLLHHKREEMVKGTIKHIIIPDFIKTLNQKKDTVDTLITFLNSYTEEGVRSIQSYAYNIELKTPMRGGLVTTIAIKDFQKMRKSLAAVGFLSRMLILSFSYTQRHIQSIFEDIALGRGVWTATALDFPKEAIEVGLDGDLAKKLIEYSQQIGARFDSTGFRAQHTFQSLAKASALSDKRTTVTQADIDRVIKYATDYVGLQYHKIGLSGCVDLQTEKELAKDVGLQGRLPVGV